jgi:predicted dehydrogenase
MINAAIVGLGRWGQNLVNSVQGKSEKIRFTAGVLRHPEKARSYARERGLTLHSSVDAVLRDAAIDAIVLATPHSVHAEQIMAAVNAGKPVFTEKPFTLDAPSARQVLRAAAKANVTVAVGYNWRFQPALQEIRRMLTDGRLGKLLHIEGNFCGPSVYRFKREHWRQQRDEGPAGGMTGRGVHVVDAMLYLAGGIDSVHAQSFRRALDYGIDDTTSMLFRFAGGASGYLGTIIATAETWRMQVFGSKGWAEVGDVEHLTTWQMKVCYVDRDQLLTHRKPQLISFPEISTERAELEHFADAVSEGRLLALPGGDEEHGAAVLDAIIESARSGRSVQIVRSTRQTASRSSKTPKPRKTVTSKAGNRSGKSARAVPAKVRKLSSRSAQPRKRAARK